MAVDVGNSALFACRHSDPPSLAVTGAGVSVLALIGLGLVSGGLVLVRRRRNPSGEVPA